MSQDKETEKEDKLKAGEILAQVDRHLEEHNLLNDPFYQPWSAGQVRRTAFKNMPRLSPLLNN